MKNTNKDTRIFKNPLLEKLSHVHPSGPLLLWVPVASYFLWLSLRELNKENIALFFTLGIIFWSLFEYVAHRFLFHFKAKSPLGKWFIFMFHGVHHTAPDDKTRLLFPPAPAAIVGISLYSLLKLVLPQPELYPFFLGTIIGYLIYDYIHYATHHFKMRSKIGRFLKHYHLKHHYVSPDKNFGVSSPLWDYIFKTNQKRKS